MGSLWAGLARTLLARGRSSLRVCQADTVAGWRGWKELGSEDGRADMSGTVWAEGRRRPLSGLGCFRRVARQVDAVLRRLRRGRPAAGSSFAVGKGDENRISEAPRRDFETRPTQPAHPQQHPARLRGATGHESAGRLLGRSNGEPRSPPATRPRDPHATGPGCIRLGPGRVAPVPLGRAGGYQQRPDPGTKPPGPDSVVILTCLFNLAT